MNALLRSMLPVLQDHSALVGAILAAGAFGLLLAAELLRPWRGHQRWTPSRVLEIAAAPLAIALLAVIAVRFAVIR
jgi:uncharacterized membrane protein SpoIIM required for sporulation